MPIFVSALHASVAALLVFGESKSALSSAPVDEIVAIVNEDVITRRDVDEQFGRGTQKTFGLSEDKREAQWYKSLLDLVVEKIQIQAAKKRDLAVQSNYVADELEKKRAGRTEAEFRDIIDQQGYTLEEFEKFLENEHLETLFWWTQFNDRMSRAPKQRPSRSIEVRPNEVRDYYNANREKFRVRERARVSVIKVNVSRVGSRDAASAIVSELRVKIEAGADFAELARQHSSFRADQGGDLGWFERDAEYLQPIMEFAFSKPPGTLSPVVMTGDAALLFRQDGYEPETMREFAAVSRSIQSELRRRKIESLHADIVSDLIRDAYIYPPILKERLLGVAEPRPK